MYYISFIYIFFQAIISSSSVSVKLKTKRETIITPIQPRTITLTLQRQNYHKFNKFTLIAGGTGQWEKKTVDDFIRYATHARERERENNSRECNAVFHARAITVFLRANSQSLDDRPRITAFLLLRISARRAKSPDVNRSNLDDNATICHTSSIVGWHAVFKVKRAAL